MGYKEQRDKAVEEKTATVIKAEFIPVENMEVGDEIIGKLLAVGEITPTAGGNPYKKYRFDTDDGYVEFAPGGVFDSSAGMSMVVGQIYAVVFKGKVDRKGGRQMNTFDVLEIPA